MGLHAGISASVAGSCGAGLSRSLASAVGLASAARADTVTVGSMALVSSGPTVNSS